MGLVEKDFQAIIDIATFTTYITPLSKPAETFLTAIIPAEFRQPENYDIDNKTLCVDNEQLADKIMTTIENNYLSWIAGDSNGIEHLLFPFLRADCNCHHCMDIDWDAVCINCGFYSRDCCGCHANECRSECIENYR